MARRMKKCSNFFLTGACSYFLLAGACSHWAPTFAMSQDDQDVYSAFVAENENPAIADSNDSPLQARPMTVQSVEQPKDAHRNSGESLPEIHWAPLVMGEPAAFVSYRSPSDCPECGKGCVEPKVKITRQGAVVLESAEVGLDFTEEELSFCVRFDGRKESDEGLNVIASNDLAIPLLLQAEEDGKKVYERFVREGDRFDDLAVLQGRRRLTYRFSIDPQFASLLPARASLNLIRIRGLDSGYSPPNIGLIVRFKKPQESD